MGSIWDQIIQKSILSLPRVCSMATKCLSTTSYEGSTYGDVPIQLWIVGTDGVLLSLEKPGEGPRH